LPWAEANLDPKSEDEGVVTEVVRKKKKKVVFGSPTIMEVPGCLLQSDDLTWKFTKAKFGPDMEFMVAPPLALLRAVRLAAELSQ
jgi:hypothetical protein